ncbi:MAG TPA: divergent PAP2 family protein [Patescibacteria group bacterium]
MPFFKPYYIFLIPVAVGVVVQAIKFIVFSLKHGWDINYAMTHGHMPSAHTGFIVSLVTSVGYYNGLTSGAFAVAMALAIIVIDDAARLRMYMGDQGRYLNMLIRQLNVSEEQFPRLQERVGHRVSEVIVGGILGFILTIALARLLG